MRSVLCVKRAGYGSAVLRLQCYKQTKTLCKCVKPWDPLSNFLIYPGRPQEYSENSIFSPLYNAESQKKYFQFSAKTDYLLALACHWKGIKTRQHHMGNNTQLAKAPLAWHDFQNVFSFFQFGANRKSKGWDIFFIFGQFSEGRNTHYHLKTSTKWAWNL